MEACTFDIAVVAFIFNLYQDVLHYTRTIGPITYNTFF